MILGSLVAPVLTMMGQNKWLVAVVGTVALLGGAVYVGYQWADGSCEEDRRKELEKTIAYYEKIIGENELINQELYEQLAAAEANTRTEVREVYRYVEGNDHLGNCRIDAAGLQIWNGEAQD